MQQRDPGGRGPQLLRAGLIAAGVAVSGAGLVGTGWTLALPTGDTIIVVIGLAVAILGVQAVTVGLALRIIASDWPPMILFRAGVEVGEKNERQRQQRGRMAVVEPLRDQVGGQS